MCIDQTAEDFTTIHHELGHNFYSRAYTMQPPIFRDSANDGFHEAIGDTIALSVTPEYLGKVGLDRRRRIGRTTSSCCCADALATTRVPAVRAGRRSVALAGVQRTGAARQLQPRLVGAARAVSGCQAGVAREAKEFFDPGAKYHMPANTPYARYFLASVLQFQFHRALTKAAGLHRAAAPLFDLRQARGRQALKATLEMGASRPWPDALEALTRTARDGCERHGRLLRPAEGLARRAEQRAR